MSTSPRVSIVLPTYNGSRYLAESLDSCRAQTFTDWELIVVDDASTDETPQVIARYAALDPRVRGVRHPANRKLPAALNTGFAQARGALLTWTSDDNHFHPEALATLAGFLDAHPDVGVAYSDYSFMDEDGRPYRVIRVRGPENLAYENVVGSSFLYRREVHEALGGYDEGLFLAEDYDFWLRAASRFRLAPVHKNLYYHRVHSRSLSETRPEARRLAGQALERQLPALTAALGRSAPWFLMGAGLKLSETTGQRRHLWGARRAFLRALWSCPGTVARNLSAAQLLRLTVGMHCGDRLVRWYDRAVNRGLRLRLRGPVAPVLRAGESTPPGGD